MKIFIYILSVLFLSSCKADDSLGVRVEVVQVSGDRILIDGYQEKSFKSVSVFSYINPVKYRSLVGVDSSGVMESIDQFNTFHERVLIRLTPDSETDPALAKVECTHNECEKWMNSLLRKNLSKEQWPNEFLIGSASEEFFVEYQYAFINEFSEVSEGAVSVLRPALSANSFRSPVSMRIGQPYRFSVPNSFDVEITLSRKRGWSWLNL